VTEVKPYDAPDFTLNNLDGAPVSLDDFKGKVVLVNFWATWCEPCKEETPDLQAVYEKLKDQGLVIVGVDLYNAERSQNVSLQEVRQFANRYGVTYPIVLDESGGVGQAYAIHPIPTSYFIDQQGKVRYLKIGQLSMSDVERVFRSLQATGS
jgi:thiol-disulfide isomerase/thioredoxin